MCLKSLPKIKRVPIPVILLLQDNRKKGGERHGQQRGLDILVDVS
jgi:hypothetical protein